MDDPGVHAPARELVVWVDGDLEGVVRVGAQVDRDAIGSVGPIEAVGREGDSKLNFNISYSNFWEGLK